ncbi:hypothetical protein [Exiguobacterium sp. PFWT01]|uniref:hypothetical protein n=1 Tax=Exiguobacterium sp. PFWT01 TaxID=2829816 RepID=UPI002013487E|nr:hypothetical protein [Exiguobacterium sp. PFWT01]
MKTTLIRQSVFSLVCVWILGIMFTTSVRAEDGNVNVLKPDDYIQELEPYVEIQADGTLRLKENYQSLDLPNEFIQRVETSFSHMNELIKKGDMKVNQDLSISPRHPTTTLQATAMASSNKGCGQSGHKVYWWAYNIYLDCNETRTTYQSFKAGSGASVGLATLSRYIPTPPTQLASVIARTIGGGYIGFGQMIKDEHKGNGVRIRFTGLGYAAIPSGIFPQ